MRTYYDTSFVLKTYIPEPSTPEALAILRAQNEAIPLSHVLELELRTAMRNRHGRGEITALALRAALRALEADIANGLLARPEYELAAVFVRAEKLSAKHAVSTLCRSADILHVASALEAGCEVLCSFDERQRRIAVLAGLRVLPPRVATERS